MRTALVLAFLIGCSGNPKPPAEDPTPPATASLVDCDNVAKHVAQTAQTVKLRSGASYEAIQNLVLTHCKSDAWNDETKQCLFSIKAIREGRDCASKMTDEQRTAITADAQKLRKDMSGPVEDPDHSGDWVQHVVEEPGAKPLTTPTLQPKS